MDLNKEVGDIDNVIVDTAQDIIKNQVDPNQVVKLFSSRKHGDDIILVEVDRGRIRQVISNPISNAFNFTKTGTISITRKKGKVGSVIVSVKDTGSDMDPQILTRLFTKFTSRI